MVMIQIFFFSQIKRFFLSAFFIQIIIFNLIILLILKFSINNLNIYNSLWILNLFYIFFNIDNLFQKDFSDHGLELLYLSNISFYFYVFLQYLIFWLFYQLPFLILIFYYYNFSFLESFCFFLGSWSLTLLSGFINTLTLYLLDKSLIFSIMVYPLFIPILIYGTSLFLLMLLIILISLIIIIPALTNYILIQNIK